MNEILPMIMAMGAMKTNKRKSKPIKKLSYEQEMQILIKEYELIQQKKSKLSANQRQRIIAKVEYYNEHYKSKDNE